MNAKFNTSYNTLDDLIKDLNLPQENEALQTVGIHDKVAESLKQTSLYFNTATIVRGGNPPSYNSPRAYKTGETLSKSSNHGFAETLLAVDPLFTRLDKDGNPLGHHDLDAERLKQGGQEKIQIGYTLREILRNIETKGDFQAPHFDPETGLLFIQYKKGKGPKEFQGGFVIDLSKGTSAQRILTRTQFEDHLENTTPPNGMKLSSYQAALDQEFPIWYTKQAFDIKQLPKKEEIDLQPFEVFARDGLAITGDQDTFIYGHPDPQKFSLSSDMLEVYNTFGGKDKDPNEATAQRLTLIRKTQALYEALIKRAQDRQKANEALSDLDKFLLQSPPLPFERLWSPFSSQRAGCTSPFEFLQSSIVNYQFRKDYLKQVLMKSSNLNSDSATKLDTLLESPSGGQSLLDRFVANPDLLISAPIFKLLQQNSKERSVFMEGLQKDKSIPPFLQKQLNTTTGQGKTLLDLLENEVKMGFRMDQHHEHLLARLQEEFPTLVKDPQFQKEWPAWKLFFAKQYAVTRDRIIKTPELLDPLRLVQDSTLNTNLKSIIKQDPSMLTRVSKEPSVWNPIQHGAESRNPYKPSDLNGLMLHFYQGKTFLTRTEDELIKVFLLPNYLKDNIVEIHPGWPMDKWAPVVAAQLALIEESKKAEEEAKKQGKTITPTHIRVPEQTRASYEQYLKFSEAGKLNSPSFFSSYVKQNLPSQEAEYLAHYQTLPSSYKALRDQVRQAIRDKLKTVTKTKVPEGFSDEASKALQALYDEIDRLRRSPEEVRPTWPMEDWGDLISEQILNDLPVPKKVRETWENYQALRGLSNRDILDTKSDTKSKHNISQIKTLEDYQKYAERLEPIIAQQQEAKQKIPENLEKLHKQYAHLTSVQKLKVTLEPLIKAQTQTQAQAQAQAQTQTQTQTPIEKSIEMPLETSLQNSMQNSLESQIQKPLQKPIETTLQKPIETPVQKTTQKPIETSMLKAPSGDTLSKKFSEIQKTWEKTAEEQAKRTLEQEKSILSRIKTGKEKEKENEQTTQKPSLDKTPESLLSLYHQQQEKSLAKQSSKDKSATTPKSEMDKTDTLQKANTSNPPTSPKH